MNDKFEVASDILPTNNSPTNITLPGDGNTLIAQANVVNMTSVLLPMPQAKGISLPQRRDVNLNYYNLFVVGNESFTSNTIIIPKELSLTESISPKIKNQFANLNSEAIVTIKTFPSIFASTNKEYGVAHDLQYAYLGFVNEITIQSNGIKIDYQLLTPVPQAQLISLTQELSISSATAFNEFDSTHWAIKEINLIDTLRNAGVNTLI